LHKAFRAAGRPAAPASSQVLVGFPPARLVSLSPEPAIRVRRPLPEKRDRPCPRLRSTTSWLRLPPSKGAAACAPTKKLKGDQHGAYRACCKMFNSIPVFSSITSKPEPL